MADRMEGRSGCVSVMRMEYSYIYIFGGDIGWMCSGRCWGSVARIARRSRGAPLEESKQIWIRTVVKVR